MSIIYPYILFDGNCREAMMFYKECFDGELVLETVKGSSMESQWPQVLHNNIIHACLVSKAITIMASDRIDQDGITVGNDVTVILLCKNNREFDQYFKRLAKSSGGMYRLHAAWMAELVDEFGVRWFLKL